MIPARKRMKSSEGMTQDSSSRRNSAEISLLTPLFLKIKHL